MLIACPNCGLRSVEEFVYGGETREPAPREADTDTRVWFGYVFERTNADGPQSEWWYHHLGCQLWFLADRDTTSNRVLGTRLPADARDD